MAKVQLNTPSPDFTLIDFNNQSVQLSEYKGKKNIVLVFNRGFF